jgi:CRISPR type IV-associated protein Csf3
MDREHVQDQLDTWRDNHHDPDRFEPVRVTADLAGPVSLSSPGLHLDSLLAYGVMRTVLGDDLHNLPDTVTPPFDTPIPVQRVETGDAWVYQATVAELEDHEGTSVAYWRKRYDETHHHVIETRKNVDIAGGKYKSWNHPLKLDHAAQATWHARGDPGLIQRLLSRWVTSIGKKRAHGWGQVRDWSLTRVQDAPLVDDDDRARRVLPHEPGIVEHGTGDPVKLGTRPPYWHHAHQRAAIPPGEPVDVAP